jgi:hypothetical protein
MPASTSLFPKPDGSWPIWAIWLYWIIASILIIAFLGTAAKKMFKFIPKGHSGILTRRCRPVVRNGEYVRKGPGIHWIIPFTDNIVDDCVLNRVSDCAFVLAENSQDSNKRKFVAEVQPTWHVVDTPLDLHNAIFKAENLEVVVSTEVRVAVGKAVRQAEDVTNLRAIEKHALKLCRKFLRKTYGVKLLKLGLVSVTRVPEQVLGDLLGSGQPSDDTSGVSAAQLGATVSTIGGLAQAQ